MGLSDGSLEKISSWVGLEGTGEGFSTPLIYRFLEKYVPAILRSITNVHIRGAHKVPMEGAAIFCGNHLGNLDPFIKILASQRPIHFMAKEGHFERQPTRFVMISTGQIETFREHGGRDALARAVDVIQSGRCLGVFPEGTRSRRESPPLLQPAKTGFARLAARFPNVPVVPVTMSIGARDFMPQGSKFPKPWKRIELIVDDPITFAEWAQHPEGGGIDDNWVVGVAEQGIAQRQDAMRSLYRKFADQFIETQKMRGAP
ncbi:MAG: lysophospholipid acyltransferase family protein [Candidatus Thalassarchaeaceae archaeon]|nr:lysophospholipid acyltransferase family protein [Candidatus Thalassarchaeaceae archaeon]